MEHNYKSSDIEFPLQKIEPRDMVREVRNSFIEYSGVMQKVEHYTRYPSQLGKERHNHENAIRRKEEDVFS